MMSVLERTVVFSEEDVNKYAAISGDYNPIHFNKEFAAGTPFKKPIIHGTLLIIQITTLFANEFPGPGTVYLSHEYRFLKPAYVNDSILIRIQKMDENEKRHLFVSTQCFNSKNELIFDGTARLKKY